MWHHDVTNPRTCQFSAVCLTVFPFEFRPRTFTIGFYGKNSIISELMILECSFPLTTHIAEGNRPKSQKHMMFLVQAGRFLCIQARRSLASDLTVLTVEYRAKFSVLAPRWPTFESDLFFLIWSKIAVKCFSNTTTIASCDGEQCIASVQ